jgi:uncharacterized membrane protein
MTTATYSDPPAGAEERKRGGNGSAARDGERLAKALGAFSVGLGLTQLLAPDGVARAIGLDENGANRRTMRALGLREFVTGIGLLSRERPTGFAWGRVTGDAMDLALLGRALSAGRNDNRRLAAATAAVAGVMLLDIVASQRLGRGQREGAGLRTEARPRERGVRVQKAITINRPPEEVYGYWRRLENLPRFMVHLDSVRELDAHRSYWRMHAPLGMTVEWTAEIVENRPNELISWRSVEDSQVPNSGTVRFRPAPGGRGTEVHLEVRYDPPAGALGATIARLLGREPSQQVDGDLRRFKQVLETGEVVHSDASIHRGAHPARPPEELPTDIPAGSARGFGARHGGFE